MNSMPCAECLNAMKYVGIRYVYYSAGNGLIIKSRVKTMTSPHLNHSCIREAQVICAGKTEWYF